jgi:hypothetical protein
VVASRSSVAPEVTAEEAASSSCKLLAADGGSDFHPARVPKDHAAMAWWVDKRVATTSRSTTGRHAELCERPVVGRTF